MNYRKYLYGTEMNVIGNICMERREKENDSTELVDVCTMDILYMDAC